MDELYEFLDANNTEDPDHVFREHYSREFLKWTLVGSDEARDHFAGFAPLYVAVEVEATHKLVAFVAAVPMVLRVYNKYVSRPHACGTDTCLTESCRCTTSSCCACTRRSGASDSPR
jgi:hypothetical protein